MVIEVGEHLQPVFLSQHHSGPPSQMSIPWTPPFLSFLSPGVSSTLTLVLFQDPGADRRKGVQGAVPATSGAPRQTEHTNQKAERADNALRKKSPG